ncbi:MAG: peptidoglycan-binding domain-containing protein [Bryobacteraceae bacterium]
MKCIGLALLFLFAAMSGIARADQTMARVQQALKEQGFFYGDVTGQKTTDTMAAIRRYQIRNGLQITGEIDAETLRSLGVGAETAHATPAPQPTASPVETPTGEEEVRNRSANDPRALAPLQPRYDAPGPRDLRLEASEVFDGTPYEIAPPDLQRHVIVGAQVLLARAGYYRSGIDGEYGPGTAAAVRAFQLRAGIAPGGRLNMETLSALGLLPGQHGPAFSPGGRRHWPARPVYRGQWIPE